MTEKSLNDAQDKRDELAKSWMRLVNCITHDLITPLTIIRMGSTNLDKFLNTLWDGYQLAFKHNLLQASEVEKKKLQDIIHHLSGSLKKSADKMQDFLNLLYPYTKQLPSTSEEITQLPAKIVIKNVIKEYPFTDDKERSLVHVDFPCDFTFNCAPVFIDNLLYNLLQNALRAIQKAHQGQINIWTEEGENYYTLHFKDSALGMSQDKLSHLFQRFFSNRDNQIVPGLGFCRLALLQRGGDILCQSVVGEYTDFSIQVKK